MTVLGIIGGTGIDQLEGLEIVDNHAVETPYGDPSRVLQEGRLGSTRLFFLQRHGSPRAIPPHLINYRANLWALRSLGVSDVVAINAVGGISAAMRPGRLVIPDQLIDYTWGREHTVDTGEHDTLMHIDFTEPYDRALRQRLLAIASEQAIAHEPAAVHGVKQGPRLETAAEIRRMANDGCDLVGMTGMPEASLARELGLAYASVCMVVNAAAGLDDAPLTLDAMRATLQREAAVVSQLLGALAATY
ncbi:S-methyl-5'-thioinosine phosphorylase [Seongchinamella sediminis]|uniref:Probable 6-oxopurine nucleoside phosphorylase n=1 Tax=Seongchinamella sediminis TaxID=2283635 RepID=A0A3L7E0S5_9GAMM|nr:S-methyl-5'-thioinosine phosphorylase [Seongchinamella sediminis]RLQ23106.1 S-methyl-5'-thioinosine phosphorylase [Seongchinamella sediminis]